MAPKPVRPIRIDGKVAYIPLGCGLEAIIDAADAAIADGRSWQINRVGRTNTYAATKICANNRKISLLLHRLILNAPKGMFVDHINGNGLDCRRANMRLATPRQNQQNMRKPSTNSSGVKGVYFCRSKNRWRAVIRIPGGRAHLGYFAALEDAASAYSAAAQKFHGDFARLE